LFKENRLAKGEFVGLGRKLNLRDISCPTYLLAGVADDITTPEQVLDAARYFDTPREHIVKETVPGRDIGLFMGARTLKEHWPAIAKRIVAASGKSRRYAIGQQLALDVGFS
jgi:poly(3-hydroxyalkanoate) synthetase